jgi:hypothetical protein
MHLFRTHGEAKGRAKRKKETGRNGLAPEKVSDENDSAARPPARKQRRPRVESDNEEVLDKNDVTCPPNKKKRLDGDVVDVYSDESDFEDTPRNKKLLGRTDTVEVTLATPIASVGSTSPKPKEKSQPAVIRINFGTSASPKAVSKLQFTNVFGLGD